MRARSLGREVPLEEGGPGNPLQYPCLETSMDRGAWWATVHGVSQSRTRLKHLSTHAHRDLSISTLESVKGLGRLNIPEDSI